MATTLKDVQKRSFHADEASKYILPNDAPEHTRLELQHNCFVTVLENKLSRAPVSNPTQILDVGCGTGCMSSWFAESFPAAIVTGLDLFPVPKLRAQPANLRYLQGNVLQQSPREWIPEIGERPILEEKGMFDLVFSRLLIAGITDWEQYIAKQFSLVKPGGWAECQELVMECSDSKGQPIDLWGDIIADSGMGEIDDRCGEKIKGWMLAAGYEMVETEIAILPLGDQGQRTQELREVGEFFVKDMLEVCEIGLKRGPMSSQPEEAKRLMQNMRATLAKADGWYMKFYVTYGRKPE